MSQSCICTWNRDSDKVTTVGGVLQIYQKVAPDYQASQNTDQSLQKPSHLHFIDCLAPTLSEVPDSKL